MRGFDFLKGRGAARIEEIESMVKEMLERDRLEVELAMAVLLGELEPREANEKLRAIDREVNRAEREIRRQLIVHASVFGSIEIPSVLLYMSIIKDIERIGDYAKNLIDLALDGVTLEAAPDLADWKALAEQVSTFIGEATEAFHGRNVEQSNALIARGDRLLGDFNRRVSALVKGTDLDPNAVARALALRYLKRIVAHLLNVLSGVVMPLDRLDYFDENPADRA